jgi:hypothetical protein
MELGDLEQIIAGLSLADLCQEISAQTGHDRVGSYQYTHSGGIFFPCDPHSAEVFIKDIARGLSGCHRFNSQTTRLMTVAEHCYLASFIGPKETALERLMHDAAEAYISDVIRPLKVIPIFGAIYLKIERGIELAIAERYDLRFPYSDDVKLADETVLKAELGRNIGSSADPLWDDKSVLDDGTRLRFWSPGVAEDMFLNRFHELALARDILPF